MRRECIETSIEDLSSYPQFIYELYRLIRVFSCCFNRAAQSTLSVEVIASTNATPTSALGDFAFRPYPSIVTLDDFLSNRKSYPGSGELTLGMQPVKWLEQILGKSHVKSGSIVTNKVNVSIFRCRHPNLDMRIRVLAGVFPGILNKISSGNRSGRTIRCSSSYMDLFRTAFVNASWSNSLSSGWMHPASITSYEGDGPAGSSP